MTEKDKAIRLTALQHLRVPLFAFHIMLCIAYQNRVALAQRGVFDALEDQREKWIRNVRNRHKNFPGSQSSQVLRGRIRRITKHLDSAHDLSTRARSDDLGTAEDTRNGCRRDTGTLGDSIDIGYRPYRHWRRHHNTTIERFNEKPSASPDEIDYIEGWLKYNGRP